ncbi:MAG: nitronate monooxygenase [Bryobacterales bacterium]|nr:nitronate monooxygenase [Bryobacterales bacterium]
MMQYPVVIQGGMGVAVSNWRLARAVAECGQLGVVSGTALDQVLLRRLEDGDPGGHLRRALDHFPFPAMAARIRDAFFIPGGKAPNAPYSRAMGHTMEGPRAVQELCIVANFVEVFLAKEGHSNPVGINYLEKIQRPHLPSMYGAMLAGVDYVLMGAGIPLKIPGALDALSRHEPATYPLVVKGADANDNFVSSFAPLDFIEGEPPPLTRPRFLAIIASNTLAATMLKRASGKVDGFIVEGPVAGGHNAPPRGKLELDENGEPVYGERDIVDLPKLRELNVPFWLAGGYGSPEKIREALAAGAAGVQVGTPFAFCVETGLAEQYRLSVLADAREGKAKIFTDPLASPTSFPFKVVPIDGSLSDGAVYEARPRICDLGYLQEAYKTAEGKVDFRCAGEPLTTFAAKGGDPAESPGRKCLCNALMANVGLAQSRNGHRVEQGLVTAGNDVAALARFLPEDGFDYTAADVLDILLGPSSPDGEPLPAAALATHP